MADALTTISLLALDSQCLDNVRRRLEESSRWSATGCLEWQRSLGRHGYGRMNVKRYMLLVHRVSYTLSVGSIPDGLMVLHHCDNRKCINPAHLYLGTNTENTRDKVVRHRVLRGERAPGAKLTEGQVRAILADTRTHRLIAMDHGVTPSMIDQIKSGKCWKSVRAVDQLITDASHLVAALLHMTSAHAEAMRHSDAIQVMHEAPGRALAISRDAERLAFTLGQLIGVAGSSRRGLVISPANPTL